MPFQAPKTVAPTRTTSIKMSYSSIPLALQAVNEMVAGRSIAKQNGPAKSSPLAAVSSPKRNWQDEPPRGRDSFSRKDVASPTSYAAKKSPDPAGATALGGRAGLR